MKKITNLLLFTVSFGFCFFIFGDNPKVKRSLASGSKSLADMGHTRSYIILDENVKTQGLMNKPEGDGEYTRRLVGKLLQSAHKRSHNDWLMKENSNLSFNTYNTFLLLSLQVPYHESGLMHFVKRSPEYCYFANDILDPINPRDFHTKFYPKKIKELTSRIKQIKSDLGLASKDELLRKLRRELSNEKVRYTAAKDLYQKANPNNKKIKEGGARVFNRYTGLDGKYKHCTKFMKTPDEETVGLKFSNDYQDVGLLQFNVASHWEFFRDHEIFNFNVMVDYGVEFLYDEGFNFLVNMRNLNPEQRKKIQKKKKIPTLFKKLECFENLNMNNFQDRIKVVQGSWAGRYNSGHVMRSCRITKSKYSRKLNDDNFKVNLSRLFYQFKEDQLWKDTFSPFKLSSDDVTSLYEKFLPVESLERKAFDELVENVYYGKNNKQYLTQVLSKNYDSKQVENIENHTEILKVEEDLEEEAVILAESDQGEPLVESYEVEENIAEKPQSPQQVDDVVEGTIDSSSEKIKENEIKERSVELIVSEESIHVEEIVDIQSTKSEKEVEVILKEDLMDIIPPQEIKVDIPLKNVDRLTYMIRGANVNLRVAPDYADDKVCGNTKNFNNKPVKLSYIKLVNDFVEVQFDSVDAVSLSPECRSLKTLFIHKYYVERVEEFGIVKQYNYIPGGPRPLRLKRGKSQPKVGLIGPGIINVIDEHTYLNKYLWYRILSNDGKKYWIYIGNIELGTLRAEVINE